MARLIAMSQQEEKQNNRRMRTHAGQRSAKQTSHPYNKQRPYPSPHKESSDMALLKIIDRSVLAETARYLYEPLPVEKFKWQR